MQTRTQCNQASPVTPNHKETLQAEEREEEEAETHGENPKSTMNLNPNKNVWIEEPVTDEDGKLLSIIDSKFPNIFNLTRIQLSISEKQLLSKGFKFCPDPRQPNIVENKCNQRSHMQNTY